jgi:rRNA biogenesis protein RRP5
MTLLTQFTFCRSFFKKWLDLEQRIGDEEGAAAVKQKAIEWTQKAANSS